MTRERGDCATSTTPPSPAVTMKKHTFATYLILSWLRSTFLFVDTTCSVQTSDISIIVWRDAISAELGDCHHSLHAEKQSATTKGKGQEIYTGRGIVSFTGRGATLVFSLQNFEAIAQPWIKRNPEKKGDRQCLSGSNTSVYGKSRMQLSLTKIQRHPSSSLGRFDSDVKGI
ncbi:hypothetical protein OUZ56_002854 [Daphnia magna]|uniref:Uncharacterized protein n=1 Tax=Daphnia magna TaxID=35525 RepID=A0ABR0A6Z1_9CRUS|nr:hypothetical protein OUZ56_002854 [Daphnia magna]